MQGICMAVNIANDIVSLIGHTQLAHPCGRLARQALYCSRMQRGSSRANEQSLLGSQEEAEMLAEVDSIAALAPTTNGERKITYNKTHIAPGTSGYNFAGPTRERSLGTAQ
jgi:hypothetical protein